MGSNALGASTTGCDNIAIGQSALAATDGDGDCNIAIGKTAMGTGDVAGADNVGIGREAGNDLTSGVENIFVGLEFINSTDEEWFIVQQTKVNNPEHLVLTSDEIKNSNCKILLQIHD